MPNTISIDRTRAFLGMFGLALLAGLAFVLISAQPAAAQAPPICAEYPDLPQCQDPGGGGGGGGDDDGDGDGDGEGPGGGGGAGPTADADAAGKLPFTGYPVTPLLMLALLLLVSALAMRAYAEIRKKVVAGSRGGPPSAAP